jgi:hypothetical protein
VAGDRALSAKSQLADGPERPLNGLAIGECRDKEPIATGGVTKGRGEHVIAGQLSLELPWRSLLTWPSVDGESACKLRCTIAGCAPMVSL